MDEHKSRNPPVAPFSFTPRDAFRLQSGPPRGVQRRGPLPPRLLLRLFRRAATANCRVPALYGAARDTLIFISEYFEDDKRNLVNSIHPLRGTAASFTSPGWSLALFLKFRINFYDAKYCEVYDTLYHYNLHSEVFVYWVNGSKWHLTVRKSGEIWKVPFTSRPSRNSDKDRVNWSLFIFRRPSAPFNRPATLLKCCREFSSGERESSRSLNSQDTFWRTDGRSSGSSRGIFHSAAVRRKQGAATGPRLEDAEDSMESSRWKN